MKALQPDTSMVILPADKVRSIVILKRDDYLEKYMDHINNGSYELLKRSYHQDIEIMKDSVGQRVHCVIYVII